MNIQLIQTVIKIAKKQKNSPKLFLAIVCFLLAVIFSFYPTNIFQGKTIKKITTGVKGISTIMQLVTPTVTTQHSPIKRTFIPTSQSPTQITVTLQVQSSTVAMQQTASSTQPTQAPAVMIHMQIAEPDGTLNFSLPVRGNVCDELTEAKNEGKIHSVTFDSSYMGSMHSLYVKEINGYTNNWTFTVNEQSPQGCSLVLPKAGDNIVWKFG